MCERERSDALLSWQRWRDARCAATRFPKEAIPTKGLLWGRSEVLRWLVAIPPMAGRKAMMRLATALALLQCCNAFTLRVQPQTARTLRAAPAVCAADDEPKAALSDEQKEALRQIAQDFFPVCPTVHVHCLSLACVMLTQQPVVACLLFNAPC